MNRPACSSPCKLGGRCSKLVTAAAPSVYLVWGVKAAISLYIQHDLLGYCLWPPLPSRSALALYNTVEITMKSRENCMTQAHLVPEVCAVHLGTSVSDCHTCDPAVLWLVSSTMWEFLELCPVKLPIVLILLWCNALCSSIMSLHLLSTNLLTKAADMTRFLFPPKWLKTVHLRMCCNSQCNGRVEKKSLLWIFDTLTDPCMFQPLLTWHS